MYGLDGLPRSAGRSTTKNSFPRCSLAAHTTMVLVAAVLPLFSYEHTSCRKSSKAAAFSSSLYSYITIILTLQVTAPNAIICVTMIRREHIGNDQRLTGKRMIAIHFCITENLTLVAYAFNRKEIFGTIDQIVPFLFVISGLNDSSLKDSIRAKSEPCGWWLNFLSIVRESLTCSVKRTVFVSKITVESLVLTLKFLSRRICKQSGFAWCRATRPAGSY